MTLYSHSRLSSFEQCPQKYKFRYIDNLVPDIKQTIEGFLGNRVHDTLEMIYIEARKSNVIELDDMIRFYSSVWHKEYSDEIKIVNDAMTAEDYYNLGIKFLIDYYFSHHPFKDNTIETEKRIVISLDDQGKYQIQGYIDRLVHHKDTNIFEVHDYKTGNFLKSQEELDHDRQLALYALGIRKTYKDVNDVKLYWHFLAFNKKMSSSRTIGELERLKDEIIQLIDKIESTKEFMAIPSCLCKWCEFRSYCNAKDFFENPNSIQTSDCKIDVTEVNGV